MTIYTRVHLGVPNFDKRRASINGHKMLNGSGGRSTRSSLGAKRAESAEEGL